LIELVLGRGFNALAECNPASVRNSPAAEAQAAEAPD